ncbi:MAG: HD domain-containing protein [Tenericutes bacterium]|nr:HD domain-containing protein [Mycoplasmatota bacterium]
MKNDNIKILKNLLTSKNIRESINNNLDELLSLIPEIKHMIGFEHNHPHHHLDVWNHVLLAVEEAENNFDVRLCVLLHDIGKPFSYQDEEVRHFKNHAVVSAKMTNSILKRLGFDKKYIDKINYIVLNHDEPIILSEVNSSNKDIEIIRLKVQYADTKAHAPDKIQKRLLTLDAIAKELL